MNGLLSFGFINDLELVFFSLDVLVMCGQILFAEEV
jgi:hypothetical protein